MGYGSQEPYEQYERYGEYEPYGQYDGNGRDDGNGRYQGGGEYGYGDAYPQQRPEYPPFPEQGGQPGFGNEYEHGYEQGYRSGYQESYPAAGLEPSGALDPGMDPAMDPQWAMSGMGWEQRAWDETRLGVSPLQEYGQGQAQPQGGLAGEQAARAPGRGSRRGAPAQEQEFDGYEDPLAYGAPAPYQDPAGHRNAAGFDAYPDDDAYPDEAGMPEPATRAAADTADAAASTSAPAAPAAAGRGAFGAAGLGAILAVAGLATTSAVLVVVALVQLGVAYGWHLAAGLGKNGRGDRRSIVLTALIGWAASAVSFRVSGTQNEMGLIGALGVGFVVLAADLMLRRRVVLGDGERLAALASAVGGALFVTLPAGFVVAERTDTGLTAACASAAAVGVLCCALLGRNPLRGILVGLVAGAAVGASAATSFSAAGGLDAGALGGAVAAVASAAGSGALDRMAAEGGLRGSTRIVAQTLPIGLAAVGAVIATAMFR